MSVITHCSIILFCSLFVFPFTLNAQVVLNEVMLKPSPSATGADAQSMKMCTQPTYGREWVELYNTSPCETADISCFILAAKTTSSNEGAFSIPAGTTIPPLGFIIIGGPNATNVDIIITDYCATNRFCGNDRWYLENTDGWVALYDTSGNVADAVYWTSNAGESAKLTAGANEFDFSPCTPAACSFAGVLKKARNMTVGTEINYAGEASSFPSIDKTVARIIDGGTWKNHDTASPKSMQRRMCCHNRRFGNYL